MFTFRLAETTQLQSSQLRLSAKRYGTFMKNIHVIFILLFCCHFIRAQEKSVDTIVIIKNQKFEIRTQSEPNNLVQLRILMNSSEILNDKIDGFGLRDIDFIDFNNDNFIDIKISYFGNNETASLYLFNDELSKLVSLEGFERFASSKILRSNSQYYYSYNRTGCADSNWESSLFKIVNYKTVALGYIYGQGCEFELEKNPKSIKIYKVNNNEDKKLFLTYQYDKFINSVNDKWEFIEQYWNSNYRIFNY